MICMYINRKSSPDNGVQDEYRCGVAERARRSVTEHEVEPEAPGRATTSINLEQDIAPCLSQSWQPPRLH